MNNWVPMWLCKHFRWRSSMTSKWSFRIDWKNPRKSDHSSESERAWECWDWRHLWRYVCRIFEQFIPIWKSFPQNRCSDSTQLTIHTSAVTTKEYLVMIKRNQSNVLRRLITVDGIWIHNSIPKTNQNSVFFKGNLLRRKPRKLYQLTKS